jgi:DNA-binding transcriptional ArsR family regulator
MKNFSNEAYYLFFSTLASRTRLAIIDVLRDGPKNISELSEKLQHDQDVIVQNLERLQKCVIVFSEGSGKDRRFSLNKEVVEPLSEILSFHTDKYCPTLTQCIVQEKLKAYMKKEAARELFIEHE